MQRKAWHIWLSNVPSETIYALTGDANWPDNLAIFEWKERHAWTAMELTMKRNTMYSSYQSIWDSLRVLHPCAWQISSAIMVGNDKSHRFSAFEAVWDARPNSLTWCNHAPYRIDLNTQFERNERTYNRKRDADYVIWSRLDCEQPGKRPAPGFSRTRTTKGTDSVNLTFSDQTLVLLGPANTMLASGEWLHQQFWSVPTWACETIAMPLHLILQYFLSTQTFHASQAHWY